MDTATVVNRLRAIATDHDLEADKLYEKARRGGVTASCDRSDATGKRADADFLREVADDYEAVGG